ncbi:DAK2 domain-containing protein [Isoptericola variabilis]|uniref:Dak phosphatase n=1 Tax=Isoptericola variabilis (strain 225) TaxID=743718 RepID=F6FQ17_ISOV2|nr:DAK2 domain-containing protein [Isoptericola variabilis]AEG44823.1 Dak phosphatase [Isoptericola variabilis 225]
MTEAELLDAAVVRTWARLAAEALGRARTALDGVNVFPVADGDTGTNMHLTLREAADAIRDTPDDAGGARLLRLMARGALLGARGNSGVILSEWLRGLAVAATHRDPLAPALDAAARSARRAVAHPEPGTILTAAEVAAAAARDAAAGPAGPEAAPAPADGHDAATQAVLDAARRGAREAALSSPASLAALRAAGVLDAGACGLVLVLHALAEAQRVAGGGRVSEAPGTMTPVTLDLDLGPAAVTGTAPATVPPGVVAGVPAADGEELELMFVLHRPAGAAEFAPGEVGEALRAELGEVGDSVVVVGGGQDDAEDADTVWQAHVHTPDLDAALAVARRWAGRGDVSHVHVRHLAVPPVGWGVVAATDAPALAADLARGGAVVLLALDVTVSADDLAQAALRRRRPAGARPARAGARTPRRASPQRSRAAGRAALRTRTTSARSTTTSRRSSCTRPTTRTSSPPSPSPRTRSTPPTAATSTSPPRSAGRSAACAPPAPTPPAAARSSPSCWRPAGRPCSSRSSSTTPCRPPSSATSRRWRPGRPPGPTSSCCRRDARAPG